MVLRAFAARLRAAWGGTPEAKEQPTKLYVETEDTRARSRRQSELLARMSAYVDKKKESDSNWSRVSVHRYVLLDRAPVAVVCDDPDSAAVQELVKEFNLHPDAILVRAEIQRALTCARLDLA